MKNAKNIKGGESYDLPQAPFSADVDDLVLELHRLRSSNFYLLRENSRLRAENQRIYFESIY